MNGREALAWLRWPFWNDAERRVRALLRMAGFVLVAGLVGWLLSKLGTPRGGLDGPGALVFGLRAVVTTTVAAVVAVRLLGRHPVRRLGIVPVPGWWGD